MPKKFLQNVNKITSSFLRHTEAEKQKGKQTDKQFN